MSRTDRRDADRHPSTALQVVAVLLIALALAGCGRKANPQPPPGQPVTYPQQYPKT